MTAKLENNQIIFGKWFARKQGWVALAKLEKNQRGYKATNYQFLNSQPHTEEDKQLNHKQKHCYHIVSIPESYTGVIVSESSIYGERNNERWYWYAKNGKIIANNESLNDLIESLKEKANGNS